ncbi:unnamed protein product [Mesocestoides corti]|nr:unnamed protein product [Mesocestoides corti]
MEREEFYAKMSTIPAITTRSSVSPGDRPSMQLLTLPSPRLRSRGGSIASFRSEDALSNLSLGSLLPADMEDGVLCKQTFAP